MKLYLAIFIVLFSLLKINAQQKKVYTLKIDIFDKNGDKYSFDKKFDHIPTREDSTAALNEASNAARKKADSLKNQTIIESRKNAKKYTKPKH
jgi:hypothetical protein